MNYLSTQEIQTVSEDPACCTRAFPITQVDLARPFIHECFTPLYYSPLYNRLSREHRLRYNQLSGMKVNEQFMLLEREYTERLLTKIVHHPAVMAKPDLTGCLEQMIEEERNHHDMFRNLNRASFPAVYNQTDYYFAKPTAIETYGLIAATSLYRVLTFLLWFLMAVEEYSVGLSLAMMRNPVTETLGVLEPNFLKMHAEHAKDEFRHVQIGALLIEACFVSASAVGRWINAYLFKAFMDYAATPLAGVRVIRHLVSEHSELVPIEKKLVSEVLAVKYNDAFRQSLFNRSLLPNTFALLDERPEFRSLYVPSRA